MLPLCYAVMTIVRIASVIVDANGFSRHLLLEKQR